ncbi:fibroblast growth factor-binding protein 2-like [Scleropages formosus]|uniref:fibroblast growth factor-binding protein 2-like n=1 Tax=Scleropages formosus TaxID=113540 RepID=UPI0010FA6F97|nr:fibroblast growth factor-binding protein 2-like [Scleropages formosus]
MRIPAASLLLLLIPCCLWTVQGQNEGNRGTWDEPIPFNNKAKEFCSMVVTAQDEATRLKVSCKSANKEYSCEFLGRPQACRSYNNNPKHYFTQIMWELRKLANACEGPRALKPLMCKRATDEAQMVGAAKPAIARPAQAKPAQTKPPRPKPEAAPAKPPRAKAETAPAKSPRAKAEASQSKAAQPKAEMAPAKTTQTKPVPAKPAVRVGSAKKLLPRPPKTTPAQPTEPTTTGAAEAMAQEYCWESLQSLCAYVIGWFHN